MSDPMQGRPPQGPPQGPGGENPIEENRSLFNPTDLAAMGQNGQLSPDMTVGDFITGVLKVPLDAPLPQLMAALKKQSDTASPMGKVQAMAGPQQGPPPGGQPASPPPGGGGIDSLMQGMGGM
jgi:hypothetical protein